MKKDITSEMVNIYILFKKVPLFLFPPYPLLLLLFKE